MFGYNVVRYFFGYAFDKQGVKKQSVNQEPVNKELVNNTYVKSQSSRSKGNHIYIIEVILLISDGNFCRKI